MKSLYYYIFILLFLSVNLTFSQNSLDLLNQKKKEIQKQIDENRKQLENIESSKRVTVNKITLKIKSIQLQTSLLSNTESQIKTITTNLNVTTKEIDSLSLLVEKRKSELVKIYRTYYKKLLNKNNILLYILASNSLNQAYSRLKMYKNLINYFNLQIKLLNENIQDLNKKRENYVLFLKELKLKQAEYQNNLIQIKTEKNELEKERTNLEKAKKELGTELKNYQKRLTLIDLEIKRIIEENAKAVKLMNKENVRIYNELGSIFKQNKGKLPPPSNNTSILNTFGDNQHPILKNVKTRNNGIDLILNKNNYVYAIFKGQVKKIFNVPYGGKALIIRHGEYLTVYSNLSNTNVKVGDIVETGQKIGEVMLQPDNTLILHFELWNEKEPENPSLWINF